MKQNNICENLSKEYLNDSYKNTNNYSHGFLYIIATPIGNYEDISLRSIKLLKFVDILLCEDTRKTKKLLSSLEINFKKLMSYNDHNAEKKRPYILSQLRQKKAIGLVSDAGTPLISDPGYKLLKECYSNNINVTHAPGPSAVINAVILSGLPTDKFYFGGFLLTNKNSRERQLMFSKDFKCTGVWFDTCVRLKSSLGMMLKVFGNRKVSILREMTKIHEEIILSNLQNILSDIKKKEDDNRPLKGEVVVVIGGPDSSEKLDINTIRLNIRKKLGNLSLKQTVNEIFLDTGISRKIIYKEAIKIKNNLS